MAHPSAAPFLVLHVLRLKGFAETDVVARAACVEEHEVVLHCKDLVEEGLVQRRDGKLSGWSLTKAGRARHATLVAEELDASGQRSAVDGAYRGFLEVNGDMLATCTAWQLREVDGAQVINDHSDAAWDRAVIERLVAIDDRVRPVLAVLDEALERYRGYPPRLQTALERVLAGQHEWFTRPVIDSYHTVWFELHEDLLSTLGVERSSEAHH